MTYELHPLCTLFPRLSSGEFDALTRFTGVRRDGLCLADFWLADNPSRHWHFKMSDGASGTQSESRRPISEAGVRLVLDEFGGLGNWTLTPAERTAAITSAGRIYFVRSGSRGPVKIGWTSGPVELRVAELQCGNPETLRVCHVIEDMAKSDEAALHRRFASLRIRGEWFDPAVLALEAQE